MKMDEKTGIKKDENDLPCSVHMGDEKCKISVRKYEDNRRVR
jgi:hypothetical protein